MGFTFPKEEHLCSRQLIDRLYNEGHRLMAFPYSVQWLLLESPQPHDSTTSRLHDSTTSRLHDSTTPCQVMIVAPKRKFHHAVDRNHVRRLTRECYRIRKADLHDFLREHNLHLVLSLVYIHSEIMSYQQLGHKMDKLLPLLKNDILKSLES